MKTQLVLALSILFILERASLGVGLSAKTNGVYLAVASLHNPTNYTVAYDDSLEWTAFSEIGPTDLQYGSPSYTFKITLTSPDGKDVPKTPLGKTYGCKWEELHRFEDMLPHRPGSSSVGSVTARTQYYVGGEIGGLGGRPFPSPAELFEIEKPGNHVLEIQMQMFLVHKGTNVWTHQMIRFSPIRIGVKGPSERSGAIAK